VDYLVRQARITDVDRLFALCVEAGIAPTGVTPLDAVGLLRQLVYMPNASVLVAEAGRQIVGGAVLGLRPSVRVGGFIGTVDVMVLARGHPATKIAEPLIAEIMASAKRKGCPAVEVELDDDATLRTCWTRHGFTSVAANTYRAAIPVRTPARR
jgi:predicted GNAT family N-acyltransferase